MPKLKPATFRNTQQVVRAVELLKEARDLLKDADCPRTVERVRAAIKSGGGALRHIDRREAATAEAREQELEA